MDDYLGTLFFIFFLKKTKGLEMISKDGELICLHRGIRIREDFFQFAGYGARYQDQINIPLTISLLLSFSVSLIIIHQDLACTSNRK